MSNHFVDEFLKKNRDALEAKPEEQPVSSSSHHLEKARESFSAAPQLMQTTETVEKPAEVKEEVAAKGNVEEAVQEEKEEPKKKSLFSLKKKDESSKETTEEEKAPVKEESVTPQEVSSKVVEEKEETKEAVKTQPVQEAVKEEEKKPEKEKVHQPTQQEIEKKKTDELKRIEEEAKRAQRHAERKKLREQQSKNDARDIEAVPDESELDNTKQLSKQDLLSSQIDLKLQYVKFTGRIESDSSFTMNEAYKKLVTNLSFSLHKKKGKIIGVTSSDPGDGKTTTCINLAVSLAETNKKVLIIDADMRRSAIAKRLNLPQVSGLSNLLAGEPTTVFRVQKDLVKFDVLEAGEAPPNPNDLLGSKLMKIFLWYMSEIYDYIFLDLAPVLSVADPLTVSPFIDGMLMVVRHDSTEKQNIKSAISQLKLINVNILGFIYNCNESSSFTPRTKYRYGYGYYYYYGYGNTKRHSSSKHSKKSITSILKKKKDDNKQSTQTNK